MEKNIRFGILYEYYGNLLNKKQSEAIEQYYLEDLSLTEIAELNDISKQAVSDMLKRSEKKLEKYEEKLGLLAKLNDLQNKLEDLDTYLQDNMEEASYGKASEIISDMIKKIT